jgi:hypothetical protein
VTAVRDAPAIAWPGLAFLALGLAALPVLAQQGVELQVHNGSMSPLSVRVVDLVCRSVLFDGELLDNASTLVEACPDADGRARIEVIDRLGRRQVYEGLSDPSDVEVEFPEP